jgi:hypothetical protein
MSGVLALLTAVPYGLLADRRVILYICLAR